ncbi:MAG: signal recognition particle protein [Spirochaetaceae bacterium]|nr:MAG: signal recognition particle protein [Spirochaetaceae bacterium]
MLERISDKLTDIVRQISGKAHISEKNIQDAIGEIKLALLEADASLRVVRRFVNQTSEEALGERILRSVAPGQQFVKIVHDKLVKLLGDSRQELKLKGPDTLSVILLLGLQGSGKTTTAAKLAVSLKDSGRKPLLVAADLVRPAAVEQLSILADQGGVGIYKEAEKNPVRVVTRGLQYAARQQYDTAIIDTSGRLQIDAEMMEEIRSVKKAAAADEVLLVADAMTGQSAVDIAKAFDEQLELTGVILSKFDSDARGGAALSVKSITGKPIKFIGTGEKLGDLEPFYPERIATRILGMGDVVTLVEKAQEAIDVQEAEQLQEKIARASFTLEDYLDQFRRVRKMGSLQSLIEMIPGARGALDESQIDEQEMKREEAIILSMTRPERRNHRIIGPSRRKRIARGSGTAVYDVNKLLRKFEKARLMMKKMAKNKKAQSAFLSQFGQTAT